MAKNEILPFGAVAGANVLTPKDYETLPSRLKGFSAGIAESKQLNTVWRQSSIIASLIAQFIADKSNKDVLDNGDMVTLRANLEVALKAFITANIDKNEFLLKANNLSDIIDKALGRASLDLAGIKITGSTAGSNVGAGTPVASGNASVAIGLTASATGNRNVVLGERSSASAESATAVGSGAGASATYATAVGSSALASFTNSTAIGYGSTTTRANEVSFGASDKKRILANVAPGTQDSDVVILGQLAQLVTKICPHSVGDVVFRAHSRSPATDFPGTTWIDLSASNAARFIRLASAAGNAMETGGRDTSAIMLLPEHTPPHTHRAGWGAPGLKWGSNSTGSDNQLGHDTTMAGLPARPGSTEELVQQPLDVTPTYITLKAWQRTA
ncbi:hypothetical protein [Serratia aquatilis]|uniref:Trimeric autotransporter adhesin YadA-like head domain-containing protein n=1 Tax=Serratia aquatilis TaxID=1737515 RepID=A0ABV6EJS2_9GAMM